MNINEVQRKNPRGAGRKYSNSFKILSSLCLCEVGLGGLHRHSHYAHRGVTGGQSAAVCKWNGTRQSCAVLQSHAQPRIAGGEEESEPHEWTQLGFAHRRIFVECDCVQRDGICERKRSSFQHLHYVQVKCLISSPQILSCLGCCILGFAAYDWLCLGFSTYSQLGASELGL